MTAYIPTAVTDGWATPRELFAKLQEIHKFDLDAAASQSNHLCNEWFGLDHTDPKRRDGLNGWWGYGHVYVNPPSGGGR